MAQAGVPDVAAIRDWVKDYVKTAIQGGGHQRLSRRLYLYEPECYIPC